MNVNRTTKTSIAIVIMLLAGAAIVAALAVRHDQAAVAAQQAEPAVAAPVPREVAGLTPGTRRAYLRAAEAAETDGVEMHITSGHRTRKEQLAEFQEAVDRYGSAEQARKFVLPPDKSAHVKGLAVDVGPRPAAAWLEDTNGKYGLCRIYTNEWWHFEYSSRYARERRCPPLKPDATSVP
ncbi:D-alanyl-D-alanine carboxypeptidase [Sinosporangium album]|uniref:D-alanyl-D-alanine carboxypeptidase n=1 Tax=Sinosporangium album TaxID=504805 RepID=A0A1G8HY48_9ACTN|nr:M15 family metallopeptidase [Sinosporangium album]SDI11482.1 D-alanyl-D-alanine carboxypeptidase [Sinosporangium album]